MLRNYKCIQNIQLSNYLVNWKLVPFQTQRILIKSHIHNMPEVLSEPSNSNITLFQPQEITKKCVDDLVSKTRQFNMIYGGYRANHNVHVFYSLYALGAPPKDLQRYFENSKTYLEPAKAPSVNINEDNWESHLSENNLYSSYLKFFEKEVKKHGLEKAFKKYIPRLIAGLTGAALHPLIHLGYAFEFKDEKVASEGLAYACAFYLPFGELIDKIQPGKNTKSAIDQLKFLTEKEPVDKSIIEKSFINSKIPAVVEHYSQEFIQACSEWGCTIDNIEERSKDLTMSTIRLFNGSCRQNTLDFFLLHSLTGNNAVKQLLPLLDIKDQVRLLNLNFVALSLLFLIMGQPRFEANNDVYQSEAELSSNYNWFDIVTRACSSTDSHVIKGVRVCHDLEIEHGFQKGLFRVTAYRCANDVLNNGWCFKGIGLLPEDK